MPSCSCHPGISLALSIVSISWCWWRSEVVGCSAGQPEGLAPNQNAVWLGENRTLGLRNGIMGEEGGLKSSSGQLVTHHCSFSSSSSHSLTHSNSPLSPSLSLRCQRLSIYGEMHSIHFQSPGFSSGAALILSEAVSTTSLTPLYCFLPFFLTFHQFWKGAKNNAPYKSLETPCRITPPPPPPPQTVLRSSAFVICMKARLWKCDGTQISLNSFVFFPVSVI